MALPPTDQPWLDDPQVEPRRLRPFMIFPLYVAWTLFGVFVYSRFSQLGDAKAYMTGAYGEHLEARTYLLSLLASKLSSMVGSLGTHLVFSLFAASGIAYAVAKSDLHGRHRWPLLVLLMVPNFGVWTSVIGREALFAGFLGFFTGALAAYLRRGRGPHLLLLALVCVGGMMFIRTPFGAAVGLLLVVFLTYVWGPRTGFSAGVQVIALSCVAVVLVLVLWPHVDRYVTDDVLPKARSYFTTDSPTTRVWVDMRDTGDLFSSLWWSLPLALVGPTPAEVAARPVTLPFFMAGLVVLGLLLHGIRVAFSRAAAGLPRKILLVGWLPAMTLTLISYVPFGIYNPGSGIRYSATFLLLLVFPSLLLSAAEAGPIRRGKRRAAEVV